MIRVVHLSDLHFGKHLLSYSTRATRLPGLGEAHQITLRDLEFCARREKMSSLPPEAQAVQCVVSGDLSRGGKENEIRDALGFVCARLGQPSLGLGFEDASVILGNHDIWGGCSTPMLIWINASARHACARAWIDANPPEHWKPVSVDDERVRVRMYLLDSTLPGLRNVLARGRIDRAQLDALALKIHADTTVDRDEGIRDVLRIAVLHHPMRAPQRYYLQMVLENAKQLQTQLTEFGFGMALVGHEHVCEVRDLGAGLWQFLSGTSTQYSRSNENAFFVYDIDGASLKEQTVAVTTRRFDRNATPGPKQGFHENHGAQSVVRVRVAKVR